MKIVILGGTFNPPHNGHLRILKAAAEAVNADVMLMIPAGLPPHKSNDGVVSAKHRLELCRLAAKEIGAEVSDMEIKREGPSYTVLTLEQLRETAPDAELYITMGADMLVTLKTWYRYADIIRLAGIIGTYRSDTDPAVFDKSAEEVRSDGGQVILLPLSPDNISSTGIRKSILSGDDIKNEVPESVADYIRQHGLYKTYGKEPV